jgi:VWFA-related protein
MTVRAATTTLLSMLLVSSSATAQVFRVSAGTVVVDVSVTRDGKPVVGLTAADFRLTDNGVAQTITDLSRETLPIDVTFIADLSGSIEGPLLAALRRAVDAVRTLLRPDDRANLVVFDQRIRELTGLENSRLAIAADALNTSGGSTSLLDAVTASLITTHDPARRRMAIVFTDGQDFGSFLDEPDLVDVAARSGVTVFAVAVTDGTVRVPQRPANPGLLSALADRTGGALDVVQRDGDIGASFVRALEDFRTSYVVHYTPQGVSGTGWHDLEVRLARTAGLDVRARKGYFNTTLPEKR